MKMRLLDQWSFLALVGAGVGAAVTNQALRKLREAQATSETVAEACQRAIEELEARLEKRVVART
jgi:cell division septum initiation protein DivIVA